MISDDAITAIRFWAKFSQDNHFCLWVHHTVVCTEHDMWNSSGEECEGNDYAVIVAQGNLTEHNCVTIHFQYENDMMEAIGMLRVLIDKEPEFMDDCAVWN